MRKSYPLLFRFDAGPEVGMGHWYRCVALAEALRSRGVLSVHFLLNRVELPLQRELQQRGIPYTQSALWGDAAAVINAMRAFPNARLVLDTMETSTAFVVELQQQGIPVASIGGSGPGRDRVELRIDGMIRRFGYTSAFAGKRLFVGPEFVILRPHFERVSPVRTRPAISSVLVALGGDASAVGLGVARIVDTLLPDSKVNVLMGPLAPPGFSAGPSILTHRGVRNPRPLMETCDVALVGGGMSAYELMRLGRPLLLLPQTDIQEAASKAFVEAGVGVLVSRVEQATEARRREALTVQLNRLREPAVREQMAKSGCGLVDGRGLQRVTEIILKWSQGQKP